MWRMVQCQNVQGWVEEPGQAMGALETSGTVDLLYTSNMQGALEAPGEKKHHIEWPLMELNKQVNMN